MKIETLAKFLFYRNRPFTRWHEATEAEKKTAISNAMRILDIQSAYDSDIQALSEMLKLRGE